MAGLVALVALLPFRAGCAEMVRIGPTDDAELAASRLKPGDVMLVSSGRYAKGWTIGNLRGEENAPITIRGEDGAMLVPEKERDGILLWQNSAWVIIESLGIEQAGRVGIVINGSSNIVVRNCTIRNNGRWGIQTCMSEDITVENCDISGSRDEHGIYFSTTDRPAARNCRIHDNAGCGIHLNGDASEGGDGMISGAIIEDNDISRNGRLGGAAVNMDGVKQSMVRRNRISDNYAGGIVVFHTDGARTGGGNRIIENTVVFEKGRGRYGVGLSGGAADTVIVSNVLVCGKGPALTVSADSARGLVCDFNRYYVHGSGRPMRYGGRRMTLEKWRKRMGTDAHSTDGE